MLASIIIAIPFSSHWSIHFIHSSRCYERCTPLYASAASGSGATSELLPTVVKICVINSIRILLQLVSQRSSHIPNSRNRTGLHTVSAQRKDAIVPDMNQSPRLHHLCCFRHPVTLYTLRWTGTTHQLTKIIYPTAHHGGHHYWTGRPIEKISGISKSSHAVLILKAFLQKTINHRMWASKPAPRQKEAFWSTLSVLALSTPVQRIGKWQSSFSGALIFSDERLCNGQCLTKNNHALLINLTDSSPSPRKKGWRIKADIKDAVKIDTSLYTGLKHFPFFHSPLPSDMFRTSASTFALSAMCCFRVT